MDNLQSIRIANSHARRGRWALTGVVFGMCQWVGVGPASGESPFAVAVWDYSPAPGQFVRDARFNDPEQAIGPPVGMGITNGNNLSVVTLGGFGGFIVFGFDHLVEDHPLNRFGLDAIVFGNAFWREGDPQRHWAECAVIEISLDANANEIPDDPWYLIPGSHIDDPSNQLTIKTWDDNVSDLGYPPAFASWIPLGLTGVWSTQAFGLPLLVFGSDVVQNPSINPMREGIFGYADYSPTLILGDLNADDAVDDPDIGADAYYTFPDDPLIVGITPGSGGGDAFDIAWAIDPTTGTPANLPGFHFIRITTAVDRVSLQVNEKSAEIDAVSDADIDQTSDVDADKDIDLLDVAELQVCFQRSTAKESACRILDHEPDGFVGPPDAAAMVSRLTGPRR